MVGSSLKLEPTVGATMWVGEAAGVTILYNAKYDMIHKKHKTIQCTREYTAVLEPAEEGGYVAYVPSLPGCATQGETVEEALTMAKDAIEGYLAVMKEIVGVVPQEIP